jgi:hypothetical protein
MRKEDHHTCIMTTNVSQFKSYLRCFDNSPPALPDVVPISLVCEAGDVRSQVQSAAPRWTRASASSCSDERGLPWGGKNILHYCCVRGIRVREEKGSGIDGLAFPSCAARVFTLSKRARLSPQSGPRPHFASRTGTMMVSMLDLSGEARAFGRTVARFSS